MKLTEMIVINRTPSAIWDVITDFEKYPSWTENTEKIIIKSVGGEKIGLRYQQVGFLFGQSYSIENKVVEWVDDRRLTVAMASHLGSGRVTYELQNMPEGTRVVYTSEILLANRYRPRAHIIFNQMLLSMRLFLKKLRDYLEQEKKEGGNA